MGANILSTIYHLLRTLFAKLNINVSTYIIALTLSFVDKALESPPMYVFYYGLSLLIYLFIYLFFYMFIRHMFDVPLCYCWRYIILVPRVAKSQKPKSLLITAYT